MMANNSKQYEALFILAISLLNDLCDDNLKCDSKKSYIYCISNSVDNKKYIGSTTKDPNCRFAEHYDSICLKNTKFYKYLRENNASIVMDIVKYVETKTRIQLNLLEDYYIYINDSIDNGLNTVYNTSITRIIMHNNLKIIEKFTEIEKYIKSFMIDKKKEINYYDKLVSIFRRSNLYDIDLSHSSTAWAKYQELTYYNPMLINNYYIFNKENNTIISKVVNDSSRDNTSNSLRDNKIIGIYALVCNNIKKIVFIWQLGGIKYFFADTICCYDKNRNKAIKFFKEQSIENISIYPVAYVYTNYICQYSNIAMSELMNNKIKIIEKQLNMYRSKCDYSITDCSLIANCFYNYDIAEKFLNNCREFDNKYPYYKSLILYNNIQDSDLYHKYSNIYRKYYSNITRSKKHDNIISEEQAKNIKDYNISAKIIPKQKDSQPRRYKKARIYIAIPE
jgi:hypothetical protein